MEIADVRYLKTHFIMKFAYYIYKFFGSINSTRNILNKEEKLDKNKHLAFQRS